jgi:hypothetical protein
MARLSRQVLADCGLHLGPVLEVFRVTLFTSGDERHEVLLCLRRVLFQLGVILAQVVERTHVVQTVGDLDQASPPVTEDCPEVSWVVDLVGRLRSCGS